MSLPQTPKLTEAKAKSKFQSLNINNIYQGAANKNTSKSVPQKHGLQSLGKVPTARRAPANLPSVKSEKGGNDPTVVLVPSGGAGWTKDGEKSGSVDREPNSASNPESKKEAPPATSITKPSGPKSWSSVTGASQGRPQTYGHQKSPLFGQEFPSLRTGEGGSKISPAGEGESPHSQVGRLQLEPQLGRDDHQGDRTNNYGPGPILRPQTFGNWTQGGIKNPVGTSETQPSDSDPIVPPQPHKPVPPGSSGPSKPLSNHAVSTSQYKSIMPPFMDVMELPTGPPDTLGPRRGAPGRSGQAPVRRGEPAPASRGRPLQTEFTPPSIIDKEKLRRMDDLGGDDWMYDDENFDYNKRLQSDDEDLELEQSSKTDPNWADQVEKAQNSQSYNFYEDMKKPGFGVDDDEKRRTKKSDEVLKNIERARQRREEEENRYRRPGSEEHFKGDERSSSRRFDDGLKENKTPNIERKDWGFEEKRGKPRQFDERRDARFDERTDRAFDQRESGYYSQRVDRKDDKVGRGEDYRHTDDSHFEDDYKHPRKEQIRSFDDRDRSRGNEESPSFNDYGSSDERMDRGWRGRSPIYNRQGSQISNSESVEMENGTSEWGARPGKFVSDWAEDVENLENSEKPDLDSDPISRPNSRDSRISKDSRGSRDGKVSRNSVEKTKKLPECEEEKPGRKPEMSPLDYDADKKNVKKPVTQDLRGYFRDTQEDSKKVVRAAPGPITREKLEAADNREATGMTQLRKRDPLKPESKPAENEPAEKLNPLLDMLENISDDEDGLLILESTEKDEKTGSGRGGRTRGGRGQSQDSRKYAPHPRGGRGGERGTRSGTRGGRGDNRGKGNHGRYNEVDQNGEESEEARKNRKNYEKFADNFNQPPPGPFMPSGQPSRRGRGEGKIRGNVGRGGVRHFGEGNEEINDESGDWNDEEFKQGRGGKIPPRMQRKRDEKRKNDGENEEEWDTASENSNEDRRKRESERGRGRGGSGRGTESRGGRRGGMHGYDNREHTPETDGTKKRSGIENIDLHNFAGVVVVDQENSHMDHEIDGSEAGEFMQVVNRKTRPPVGREERRSFERGGPKVGDKGNYDHKYRDSRDNFNKQNKNSYERRQNKLPPRLAKVRENSRAQRSGGISPSGGEQNGWPVGDKMGVFQVDDLGTTAWEKRDKEGSEGPDMRASPKTNKENGGIQQTMVFENTALKGGKAEKNQIDKTGIQLPVGLGKPEDNLEVKLDFTFGGDDLSGQGKPPLPIPRSMPHLSASQGLPASPSTDDLSAKLANTKKLWDSPGMPTVPENSATTASSWTDGASFSENSAFEGFQDSNNQTSEAPGGYDKAENVNNPVNGGKVKQQQQQHALDNENRQNNTMQFNRITNNTMPAAIPSPPTQMNQMGTMPHQPWAYTLDRTSTMYPYGPSLNQNILMQGTHSIGTDLFNGSNGAGGYRLQGTGHYPGSQQSTTNNVLISQANLISSGVKHNSQIGPIGTKAGTGANASPYLQSGMSTFIQYEPNNFNYVNPSAPGLQRGNAPPTQTAFYQTLSSRQHQLALNAALPGSYNHAMSQQQLRANHVAGLPFMKGGDLTGLGNQKSPLGDNFGTNYNNRPGGPPSPKTKIKLEQQQQQAKMAAGMNNLNSLNQLAQLRISSLAYNMGIPGVQPGYPSPIARPQMNHNSGNHGIPNKGDYYAPEGGDEKMESEVDKNAESGKEQDSSPAEKEQGEQEAVDPAQ